MRARKKRGRVWLRVVAVGLAAAASFFGAATAGSGGHGVVANGPTGCVVVRVSP